MGLKELLAISEQKETATGQVTEERIEKIQDVLRKQIAYWRAYPDMFVDFLCGDNPENFKFYFYQRVMLRIILRHRYVFITAPRAFSKSFISVLGLLVRCVLYPGVHMFVTSGGKEQACSILSDKVREICHLIPGLYNEINWERGATKSTKDSVTYVFKNGSILDILAMKDSSRGLRRNGGSMEEVILMDQQVLNEIIIPTMNVDRRLPDGTRHKEEVVNKSQVYITTAGWKNSFSYKKQMQLLIQQIIFPKESMVLGATWRVPVMEGLLQKNFINDLKNDGTYNEASFSREFESIWSGNLEQSFFSSEKLDKCRTLLQPEYEYTARSKTSYYVLGVDVGRIGCTTEVCIFKVTPQPVGAALKQLVNIYTFEAEHFESQAIMIKKIFYRYKARRIAMDTNGLGVGLLDFMLKGQIDTDNTYYPPFGVENDENGLYKKFKTEDMERDAIFSIKANPSMNTEIYTYVQTQILNNKIKMLIDEVQAKVKLLGTKNGQNMTPEQRANYLRPFTLTTALCEQSLNLVQENEGQNIILKRSNLSVKKDKFSAFSYGMYYIKLEEDRLRKRKGRDISGLTLFSKNSRFLSFDGRYW